MREIKYANRTELIELINGDPQCLIQNDKYEIDEHVRSTFHVLVAFMNDGNTMRCQITTMLRPKRSKQEFVVQSFLLDVPYPSWDALPVAKLPINT